MLSIEIIFSHHHRHHRSLPTLPPTIRETTILAGRFERNIHNYWTKWLDGEWNRNGNGSEWLKWMVNASLNRIFETFPKAAIAYTCWFGFRHQITSFHCLFILNILCHRWCRCHRSTFCMASAGIVCVGYDSDSWIVSNISSGNGVDEGMLNGCWGERQSSFHAQTSSKQL